MKQAVTRTPPESPVEIARGGAAEAQFGLSAGIRHKQLYSVKQIAERHPGISQRTLRHWIFNAKERRAWERGKVTIIPGNGFDAVMVRAGRKILIDEVALFRWLDGN